MKMQKINPNTALVNCLASKLTWIHKSKISTEFKGSCLKQGKPNFTHRNEISSFIVYELCSQSRDSSTKLTLGECLFGVKLPCNADLNKYGYNGYGTGLDAHSLLLLSIGE